MTDRSGRGGSAGRDANAEPPPSAANEALTADPAVQPAARTPAQQERAEEKRGDPVALTDAERAERPGLGAETNRAADLQVVPLAEAGPTRFMPEQLLPNYAAYGTNYVNMAGALKHLEQTRLAASKGKTGLEGGVTQAEMEAAVADFLGADHKRLEPGEGDRPA